MYQTQQQTPDSTVRPIFPSYLSNWLDSLGAYDTWEGQDQQLDLVRLLYESDAFFPQMYPFPTNIVGTGNGTGTGNILNFNAGETQTGSIQITPGAILVSAGVYCNEGNDIANRTGAGAKVRLYDKATQCDIFYGTYGHSSLFSIAGPGTEFGAADKPFGPYFFQSPIIISPPGIIQWEIVNLDPVNAATIQVLLSVAMPKGSIQSNVVVQEQTS